MVVEKNDGKTKGGERNVLLFNALERKTLVKKFLGNFSTKYTEQLLTVYICKK